MSNKGSREFRNAQGVHHYVYDGKGERLMKTSIYGGLAGINNIDKAVPYTMDPYQIYVNAYHVRTFYGGEMAGYIQALLYGQPADSQ